VAARSEQPAGGDALVIGHAMLDDASGHSLLDWQMICEKEIIGQDYDTF
jgi:hypothetical protein